jgi:beta-galactosidase
MGNAVGNLSEYWREIDSNPRLLGGFIWEWCDQGLHRKLPDGTIVTAFGGDFGDVPNHGGFSIKGLVSADRTVYPKYWEVKKVYQPVQIEPVSLNPGRVKVKITNRNFFVNLSEFALRWSVTDNDGVEIQSGTLPPVVCAPGQSGEVELPVAVLRHPKFGAEFWLRVSFHTLTDSLWAGANYEVAWQQMKLNVWPGAKTAVAGSETELLQGLSLVQTNEAVQIQGAHFSLAFSRTTATLTSLKYGGQEMLLQTTNAVAGPVLQWFRAPTDNDKGFGKWLARDWRDAGLTNSTRRVGQFKILRTRPPVIKIRTIVTNSAAQGGYCLTTLWTIHRDGSLEMNNDFQPFGQLPLLPRLGLVLRTAKELTNLHWYGRGPWENYPDRQASADLGVWNSIVDAQYVPYVRPQDNGNHEATRWLTMTDESGNGLKVAAAEAPFSFSALPFTAGDLASARHNYELRPRAETILSLDARQSGLGNSSCGPGVLEKYAVPPGSYSLRLHFLPAEVVH